MSQARAHAEFMDLLDTWEALFDALERFGRSDPLGGIQTVRAIEADFWDFVVLDLVRWARAEDRSWGEVGQALGVSRQAARARFAARL